MLPITPAASARFLANYRQHVAELLSEIERAQKFANDDVELTAIAANTSNYARSRNIQRLPYARFTEHRRRFRMPHSWQSADCSQPASNPTSSSTTARSEANPFATCYCSRYWGSNAYTHKTRAH